MDTNKFYTSNIPQLVASMNAPNLSEEDKVATIKALNKLTEPNNTMVAGNIDTVVRSGIIPSLVNILQQQSTEINSELLLAVVWNFTNITATEKVNCVAEADGAVANLVQLLQHPEMNIQEASALGIGNIAAHSKSYRMGLLNLDGFLSRL